MASLTIIKYLNVLEAVRPRFGATAIIFRLYQLVFNEWKKLSATALSQQLPLRRILLLKIDRSA